MDGENHGKPYEQMDDLGGGKTPIFGNIHFLTFQSTAQFETRYLNSIVNGSQDPNFYTPAF